MKLKELEQAAKDGTVLTLEGSDGNPIKTLSFLDEKWVIVRIPQHFRTEEEVVRDVALAEIRLRIARERAARRAARRKGK